jgi:hypothetical protein
MPIAPIFNWSLGAILFLKIANAGVSKAESKKLPPTKADDFCRKERLLFIWFILSFEINVKHGCQLSEVSFQKKLI